MKKKLGRTSNTESKMPKENSWYHNRYCVGGLRRGYMENHIQTFALTTSIVYTETQIDMMPSETGMRGK